MARVLLAIGSGVLAVRAWRRGTLMSRISAGIGLAYALWTLIEEGELSRLRNTFLKLPRIGPSNQEDLVQEASAESFPASDAPSWTPTVGAAVQQAADGL